MRKAKIIGIFLWPIFCNKKATPTSVATLVIRVRFEPTTHSLEDCCSIQLSYQTLRGRQMGGIGWRSAP